MATQTPDIWIKRHDTYTPLEMQIVDSAGTAIDVTGATARFLMRAKGSDTNKVDGAATITDAATGKVQYAWQSGDTDTAGDFQVEVELSYSGAKDTHPRGYKQYALVRIQEDLG